MSKRKINITFELEDNDLIVFQFEKQLRNLFNKSIIDFRLFPKTEHLKENESFKKLLKAKRDAGLTLDRYINENRN